MNPFEERRKKRPTFFHQPVKKFKLKCKTTSEKRIYYSPDSNKKLISVTSLLGATNKDLDNALKKWKGRIGEEKAKAESERCASRGNSVHLLAEEWINNNRMDFSIHNKNSVSLFKRLCHAVNNIDNVKAQEITLYSDLLGIAGRVDCIAEYNGILSVIDFKTSTKAKLEKWITDYFLQCSAYSYLFEGMYGIKIPQIIVIIAVEELTVPQVFISNRVIYRDRLFERINQYRKGTEQ